MKPPRNPYSPPQSNLEGIPIKDISKPVWPYVRRPYHIPGHMMLWSFTAQMLLQGTPMAGVASFGALLGLGAFVYAYRKQPAHRAAEKRWWREFQKQHR